MTIHTRVCFTMLLCLLALAGQSPASSRERVSLNAEWRFQKDDPAEAKSQLDYEKIKPWLLPSRNAFLKDSAARTDRPEGDPSHELSYTQPGFDDSGWRRIDLPHDWGIEGPFQQEYSARTGKLPWWGVGWYRKHFKVSDNPAGERYTLEVGGAMSHAAVWLNGRLVGGWPYGYASFQLDLTPCLKRGDNVLAIRLDNPKNSSRWYPGGGIYRNVSLLKTGSVRVGQWGAAVTTPEVSPEKARIAIEARIENHSQEPVAVTVTAAIALKGEFITTTDPRRLILPAGKEGKVALSATLKNSKLWNLTNRHLYTAVTTVERDGQVIDRIETPFGIRKIEFNADNGFLLNGDRVQLHGVCNHHDLGSLGTAFNVRAAERQLEIMKEMGVNALRTSHNPPAPELLDLCDRMGILVMDEAFDCWKTGKTTNDYHTLWDDWHEADLRAMIRRDRNHPSVILWSIGNEVPDQANPQGAVMAADLTRIVHEEDSTRPTTAGCDNVRSVHSGFADGIDVFGFNYKPRDFGRFRADHPKQPVFGSETASTISSRGEYFFPISNRTETGRCNFQVSSHDLTTCNWSNLPDADFAGEDRFPFGAGQFVWTGFDYIGEPTPYDNDTRTMPNLSDPVLRTGAEEQIKQHGVALVPSRSSYFGIVDLAGFKKDRFYLYQSRWRPELPMVHILPHWNWPERVGQVTPVFVYTSGDEAELFLNGKSLGRRNKARVAPMPKNLAEGKAASASSGDAAGLAIDGRSDTLWQAAKKSDSAWWQVDLGSVLSLKGIDLDFGGCARDFRYRVVASSDGTIWQPLITQPEVRGDQTHIDYPVDVRTRFVKVEFLPDNRHTPAIKEFSAYGTPFQTEENCYRLLWNDVFYEAGQLKAVAYKQGRIWAEETVKTTGPAARLLLTPDRPAIRADGEDLSFVTVTVADRDGLAVPGSKNLLSFQLTGPGEIAGIDNGDATSHEPFQGCEHHAWNGRCMVIVRFKPGVPGSINLSVSSAGLAPTDTTIQAEPNDFGAAMANR